ncbi:hypothetical protein [Arenimonas aestuarii]
MTPTVEHFDPEELAAIASELEELEKRCERVLGLLGDKRHLTRREREDVEILYRELKSDLKAAAKHGTLSRTNRDKTRAEECFFDPALRRAAVALSPAVNSNPISSRWFSAVYEAQTELAYWRYNLEKAQES